MCASGSKLNEMSMQVAAANQRWWEDLHTEESLDRNVGEMLMLVTSELSEAMEGHRKNLMDDKLPHRKMVEVELVDAVIRLMDMVGHLCPGGLYVVQIPTDFYGDNFASNLFQLTKQLVRIENQPTYAKPYAFIISAIILLMLSNGMDFAGVWDEKMAYNATRKDPRGSFGCGWEGLLMTDDRRMNIAGNLVLVGLLGLTWWLTESWVFVVSACCLIYGVALVVDKVSKDQERGR